MENNICIFCRKTNVPFTSVEHIFPESIGNKKLILPKGVVCDICNNGILSKLDKVILDFEPVAFLKHFYAIPSKTGRVPDVKLPNVSMETDVDKKINLKVQSKKFLRTKVGGFKLRITAKHQFTQKYLCCLARAFYKIALEAIHLDHGHPISLDKSYDLIRDKILTDKLFSGFIVFDKKCKPIPQCRIRYWFRHKDRKRYTLCELTLFGFTAYYFLEIAKPIMPELLTNHPKMNLVEF
ncbi:MAG: HNH endonuclease [bacterium]